MRKKAPRLGDRVEKKVRQRKGYDLPDSGREWRDAIAQDGKSVEIKAAMRNRANGKPGKFRIFREPHRQLAKNDGRYVFVAYRQRGTGAEILASTTEPARAVNRRDEWTKAGHATDGREYQIRIPVGEVF